MDRHRQVLSLGVAVDKEEEEEEVVPSLDPMLGARVNDLARLVTCVLFGVPDIYSCELLAETSQCTSRCVT